MPRPSFGLLLSPGWGPWVKGPLIPKPEPFGPESSFQSSASERLWPVGPGCKASGSEGIMAGSQGPGAGVQARVGRQGQGTAMPAADMG